MKKVIAFIVVTLIIALLSLTGFAHSGRTDSNGGHYDRSTGEYHYHHGYSAHQHYDIDGDGTIDCPYKYKDKTNHDSGNTSIKTASPQVSSKTSNNVNSFKDTVVNILIISAILIVTFLGFLIHSALSSLSFWIIENVFKKEVNNKIGNVVNIAALVIIAIVVIVISIYAKIIS